MSRKNCVSWIDQTNPFDLFIAYIHTFHQNRSLVDVSVSISNLFRAISSLVDLYIREDTLQDVPEIEIESNWDQVVDK